MVRAMVCPKLPEVSNSERIRSQAVVYMCKFKSKINGKYIDISRRDSSLFKSCIAECEEGKGNKKLTGLFNMLFRLFLPFLIWLFKALESSGFNSSKLQSNSPETDMIAPQLSNSPQY